MTFQPSYRGIGKLLKSAGTRAAMVKFAEKAMVEAEAIAPVNEKGPHPGRYKASFKVTSGVRRGSKGRAYARLTNTSPEAQFVEYGTEHNPAHHVLIRSLQALDE